MISGFCVAPLGFAIMVLTIPSSGDPQHVSIKSVQVEKQGQWHDQGAGGLSAADCQKLKLDDEQARRWFNSAREVSHAAWLQELSWTGCSVAGQLTTADGQHYPWEVDQSGRGRILVSPTYSIYLAGKELPFSP